jgi:hypothetical protein
MHRRSFLTKLVCYLTASIPAAARRALRGDQWPNSNGVMQARWCLVTTRHWLANLYAALRTRIGRRYLCSVGALA